MDAMRRAQKRGDHPSLLSRWQNDEIHRTSQLAIGWTETYVKYLDYLTTVDISQKVCHRKRNRYANMIFMRNDDPKSPSRTTVEKRRLQNNNECADVPSTRTRQRYPSYSDAYGDKTAQNIGSYNSAKFGMVQPELANVLLDTDFILFFVGHKIRHGGILNTGKILNSGESGKQKNGKTKSCGRNGKGRQQTIHVQLLPENWNGILFHLLPKSALCSQFFVQSCTFTSHALFFLSKNRFRVQTLANVVNVTDR